ncbi:MAG TPA: hypothetical protein PKD86_04440 [Gemmatales bacterium]|nr:hypothetical protein [Gemmatales bacterium]HMP58581.1 hypothetical protein [Gemmatales bacterium]
MRRVGRVLQFAGLVIVPIAIAGNLAEIADARTALTLKESLLLSGLGMSCFLFGWLLQQWSGSSS